MTMQLAVTPAPHQKELSAEAVDFMVEQAALKGNPDTINFYSSLRDDMAERTANMQRLLKDGPKTLCDAVNDAFYGTRETRLGTPTQAIATAMRPAPSFGR